MYTQGLVIIHMYSNNKGTTSKEGEKSDLSLSLKRGKLYHTVL